jgi:ring-1,2-phenylacetyl-CoA epoxidase subunit PaaC
MTGAPATRSTLQTRAGRAADVGPVDPAALEPRTREALAELLLTMADDEFVVGFWDSEWTGIAPALEEDVAFSSLAQDEIGHARVHYEILAALTGGDADTIAFGRQPDEYRHCRLLDHARNDWAFSIARRYLYDTADAVRLSALAAGSWAPLADVVAKIRREETYHLMHIDAWLTRLAGGTGEPRDRLTAALQRLWPDAVTVFSPLGGERALLDAGILSDGLDVLAGRWLDGVRARFETLGLPVPADLGSPSAGGREGHGADFRWLWGEFTSVYRSQPGASW